MPIVLGKRSESGRGLPLGLAGATAATRYVGATASGAPASGTFQVGDYVIAQDGGIYVCTAAGSPGTWASAGGGGIPATILDAKGDLIVATAADTAARQAVGTDFVDTLVPNAALTNGLGWSRPRSPMRPSATSAMYETFSREFGATTASGNFLLSQRLSMVGIWLPAGLTVTSISFMSAGTGATTPTVQLFGLYDSARALLRGTNDDGATAWNGTTVKTLALTSPFATTYSGLHYLGILVAAATVPTLYAAQPNATPTAIAPILCGTSNTGISALPNPAAALTAIAVFAWAWVN